MSNNPKPSIDDQIVAVAAGAAILRAARRSLVAQDIPESGVEALIESLAQAEKTLTFVKDHRAAFLALVREQREDAA